eukprot:2775971-Pyramimonas_sp.AAC.1
MRQVFFSRVQQRLAQAKPDLLALAYQGRVGEIAEQTFRTISDAVIAVLRRRAYLTESHCECIRDVKQLLAVRREARDHHHSGLWNIGEEMEANLRLTRASRQMRNTARNYWNMVKERRIEERARAMK